MQLRLLTYNLFFNKALENIDEVVDEHKPDIILLQEFQTSSAGFTPVEKLGYKLANFSNSFLKYGTTFGVATFYNANTLRVRESFSIDLPRSIYELMLILFYGGNKPRTVLKTNFETILDATKFSVYNIHLSWFNTNSLRIKQLHEIFKSVKMNDMPVLVGGDFNYPYGRRRFEKLIREYNLHEATNKIFYTFEKRFLRFFKVRWKLDYILYRNIDKIMSERINITNSDHYPVIAKFTLK